MTPRRVALAVLLVLAFAARVAAQAAPPESAEELLERGVSLREEGRDTEALALFRRAHELSPSGQTLAQIALAEQAVGRFVLAERDLAAALEAGGEWIEGHREALEDALERIRAQLGVLVLAGGVEGAEVRINGRSVGTMPLEPQSVQAGLAVVEVTAPGHVPYRRQVEITAGVRARREVVLVEATETRVAATEAARPADTERAPLPAGPDARLIAGTAIALALGAAGLLTFAGVGAAAHAEYADVSERCGAAMRCTEADVSTLRTLSIAADVGLGAGALALAIGGVLLVVVLSSGGEGSATARVSVGPSGIALGGAF